MEWLPGERGALRVWLLPFLVLLGGATTVFLFTYAVDASGAQDPAAALALFLNPNPESAANTLGNAGEIVAAVLAIAITVVAIVVELAANRYTHRITELFVEAPINFTVMGFYVITAIHSLWVALVFDYDPATGEGFVPRLGIQVAMFMLAACLLTLLPYFGYVFLFLNPVQIVDRIRRHTVDVVSARRGPVLRKQREAVRGVEQLSDVGLNAMENKDKGVSMASVDALYSMLIDYEKIRDGLEPAWFKVDGELAHNSDFVSMSKEVLADVSGRQIWFEMKVLRQYQTIYGEALNRMRDMNYLIAINTRRVAENALSRGHDELFDLCLKFFNTYLRATVNARDVRTAYNVLNQYRLLAERCLDVDDGARAVAIARHFKYYGLAAYTQKLAFILETAAYDLCTLNEIAYEKDSKATDALLRLFLEVDKESESEEQEASLRGVRKAQVKLATFYLLRDDERRARQIFRDMEHERPERLASIRDELLGIHTKEFWEISDRGVNFDYLTPDEKRMLIVFFDWFGNVLPPRPSMLPLQRISEIPHLARRPMAPTGHTVEMPSPVSAPEVVQMEPSGAETEPPSN